jgi:hypothetical protein
MAEDHCGLTTLAARIRDLPWQGPAPGEAPRVKMEYWQDPGMKIAAVLEPAADRDGARKAIAQVIGDEAAGAVLAVEAQVFAWLQQDPAHPAQFLADPLGSLRRIGVQLAEPVWRALERVRQAQMRTLDLRGLEQVDSLVVRVASARQRREGV